MRLNFKPGDSQNPTIANGIVDSDGQPTLLDGDADGKAGGEYNFWFNVASNASTFYVDKAGASGGNGSLGAPFNNIAAALTATAARNSDANPANDIHVVRIAGNGGTDGNLTTQTDNFAYEIGFNALGQPLADGATMQVPRGVTVMVDAGAIFRLRRANIDVGSKAQGVDHSLGHLQVLGTPSHRVVFTSYNSRPGQPETPLPGDWGGIVFRNELDNDARPNRVLEQEGIFVNYVNHGDFSYGGGVVVVNGLQSSFSPIHLNEARPTLSFNRITNSASGAIAADPNSFAEDLYSNVGRDFVQGRVNLAGGVATLAGAIWPTWATDGRAIKIEGVAYTVAARLNDTQLRLTDPAANASGPRDFVLSPAAFTADYSRVGPDIYDNDLSNNTINGLFIQIDTLAGQILDRLDVSARFDDTDIAHVLTESLLIAGTPTGAIVRLGGTRRDARLDARLAVDPAYRREAGSCPHRNGDGRRIDCGRTSQQSRCIYVAARYAVWRPGHIRDDARRSRPVLTRDGQRRCRHRDARWRRDLAVLGGGRHADRSTVRRTQLSRAIAIFSSRSATTTLNVLGAAFSLTETNQPEAGELGRSRVWTAIAR